MAINFCMRFALLLLAISIMASGQVFFRQYTVQALPPNTSVGTTASVIDALTTTDCTVGGGSLATYCRWNGTTWVAQGGVTYNVKSFGATGNGSTDDTATIQSAIVYATAHGGGTVYMPCGTYLISGAGIIISSPKINIEAEQEACTVLNYQGSQQAITVQMVPFTTDPAGTYSNLTIIGTSFGQQGILTGQIVAGHFENLTITGFTSTSANAGVGGAGIHMHNAGNLSTWTERNVFLNVTLGGIAGTPVNTNGFLLDSDSNGDSFGYNRYLDIKFNVNTGGTGFNLQSGFMYNNILNAIFNMDSTPAGSKGPVAFRSNGNWDSNFLTAQGEAITTGATGATTYAAVVTGGGRFANLKGSNLNIFNSSSAQLPVNNLNGGSTSPNVTLVEQSSNTSWDTGSFILGSTPTTPEPITRANYGSVGLLLGNNIESPYVSMFQGTGNEFDILTVPTNGVIGSNGIKTAYVNTIGQLGSATYQTACNSLWLGTLTCPGLIDGLVPFEIGGLASTHRSGQANMYFVTSSGLNESWSGDANFSGGYGFNEGTNIAHPIVWSYTLDPNNLEVYEKQFQGPIGSTGTKVFGLQHGAITQGASVQNIAGACVVSGTSCTWVFSSSFINAPFCVGSPVGAPGGNWFVTTATNGCTVNNATNGVQFYLVAVGNPN